jgi:hypothetical protein
VTLDEAADRLIGRVVAPEVSDFYAAAHQRRGVRVLLGTTVTRFEGTGLADTGLGGTGGAVTGAYRSDGGFIPADLVVIGIGAEPRTELAEQLGLACAGGIVVDAFARTSDPAIVAAGDCTVTPHPAAADGSLIRFESYGHAMDHAKVAAATLAGAPQPYSAVPWFWSNQGTLKLQIAGLSAGFDQTVLRGDLQQERFSVLYYRAGRLLAVHAVNCPRDYLAVRRALAEGQDIPAELAADPDEPLRPAGAAVLASRPADTGGWTAARLTRRGEGAAGPEPAAPVPITLSIPGTAWVRDDGDRLGRAGLDRGLDRLRRVAARVDHDGDRLVVLVEGVGGVPAALPRAHAQAPVDTYHAVPSLRLGVSCGPRVPGGGCGGHLLSLAR